MPDLLAGTTITAADTPPTVSSTQNAQFNYNATTYGIDADGGTYVDCGVAFVACTTGRAAIDFAGFLDNDTGGGVQTFVSPVIRAGSTVGAGASVVAAADANSITQTNSSAAVGILVGRRLLVTGLTPGSTYNVRLEHRVSGGNGFVAYRSVVVSPAT